MCVCALQYFDTLPDVADSQLAFFGGAVEIADFCPFSQEFSWHQSGQFQRSSFCRLEENQPGDGARQQEMTRLHSNRGWDIHVCVCVGVRACVRAHVLRPLEELRGGAVRARLGVCVPEVGLCDGAVQQKVDVP